MKKNNSLMLAYIIFLAIALLAYAFFQWEGIGRIAMAATIAGCFFAFADLYNWRANFNNYSFAQTKIAYNHLIDSHKIGLEYFEEENRTFNSILENATPYRDKDPDLADIIIYAESMLQNYDARKTKHLQAIAELENMQSNTEKQRKKNKAFDGIGLVLMIIGYVTFFSIIVFDYFVFILIDYQTFATIIAFIAIMCNYYAKEIIEENAKSELEDVIKKTEANKIELEKLSKKFKELKLSEKVDAYIEAVKKLEACNQKLEDTNNG